MNVVDMKGNEYTSEGATELCSGSIFLVCTNEEGNTVKVNIRYVLSIEVVE